MPPQATSVVFDMDGLLLDTEGIYTEITQKILDPYGKTFTWEVKSKMMGRTERDGTAILLENIDVPLTIDEYIARKTEVQEELFPKAEFMPDAEKLIRHLAAHKIPMAVATSSHRAVFNLKTKKHGDVFALFQGNIVCGDDPAVKEGKPAPDIFLEAARRIRADPPKTLVFEDAANGVIAARRAGMIPIWIPDLRADQDGIDSHATHTSLADFHPEAYGLPSYA